MLAGDGCNSILQPNLASTNVKSEAGLGRECGGSLGVGDPFEQGSSHRQLCGRPTAIHFLFQARKKVFREGR